MSDKQLQLRVVNAHGEESFYTVFADAKEGAAIYEMRGISCWRVRTTHGESFFFLEPGMEFHFEEINEE